MNDYKKMGGRVTTGSDSGFIYQTYGFGYVNELEMLQEAGFHPLEVIQSATMNGALTLHEPKGKPIEFGVIREGLLADMVVVSHNPLQNFKVLCATGAVKLNDQTGQAERVIGIKWTIKDGIAYAPISFAPMSRRWSTSRRRNAGGERQRPRCHNGPVACTSLAV